MIWYLLYFAPLAIAIYYVIKPEKKDKRIKGKNILIIGGSSGLGFSFVKILTNQGNLVTGTSRDAEYVQQKNEEGSYRFMVLDVCDESTFERRETEYDYIFYCTGLSRPGQYENRTTDDFIISINTNYLGMIKVLKHYSIVNKKPFDFIMIGSTLALFPMVGYSTYSPTKSAMLSFFYSTYDEFKKRDIKLHLFNPSNMQTRGFQRENKLKDQYNIQLESIFNIYSPEDCAKHFLEHINSRKVIVMDFFTYLCQIRYECEKIIDYFMFPLAVIVVCFSKLMTRLYYKFFFSKD
jgi:3-dehydrosphinganine reductase